VISILRLAKDKGFLSDQLAIDPLPAAVRVYYRDEDEEETGGTDPVDDSSSDPSDSD